MKRPWLKLGYFLIAMFILVNFIKFSGIPADSKGRIDIKPLYQVGESDILRVSPNGAMEFIQPVDLGCEAKEPFSITGMTGISNKVQMKNVSGIVDVLGGSRVTCAFSSSDGLPVAYRVYWPLFWCYALTILFVLFMGVPILIMLLF